MGLGPDFKPSFAEYKLTKVVKSPSCGLSTVGWSKTGVPIDNRRHEEANKLNGQKRQRSAFLLGSIMGGMAATLLKRWGVIGSPDVTYSASHLRSQDTRQHSKLTRSQSPKHISVLNSTGCLPSRCCKANQGRIRPLMHPWFALLITRSPVGQGIWTQCRARSKTRLDCSPCRTPPLGIYTTKARCPSLGGLLRIHSPAPMATGLQTSLSGFHKRTQQRFSPWAAPNRPT